MDIIVKNQQLDHLKSKEISQFINEQGSEIYKNNKFFKDLYDMMEDEKFRKFYKKYYYDWGEIKVMTMYMKLYETIEKEYFNKFKKKISKELILYIIREIFSNKESRKFTIEKFKEFETGNYLKKRIKNKEKNKKKLKNMMNIMKN